MKKIFKKENVMPVVVLSLICLIVAAALGVVNHFTSQEIENQMLIKANAGKIEVLPGLDITTMVETVPEEGKYPSEVKKISKFDVGYVIETEVKGNAAGMVVLVGIDNDGKVTGVKVLANAETPSFWSSVSGVVTGTDGKYNGQTPDTLAPEIVSGATNSSTGVYNAVKASLDAFLIAGGGEVEEEPEYTPPKSQREDSELLTLAGELVADSEGFTEVKFEEQTKYLVKVLKENGSKGYVAYVVVMSENYEGQVESETLIHIENTGKIKAVKKLVCKISDALYGYVPPTSEEVDAFYDRLPKNDSESIGNVELITNATNTSTNVRNSIKEALDVVTALIRADIPTPEADLFALAEQLAGTALDLENVTPENTEYARRIYRDKNGKGYFAYTVVINERYQRIETETLVHVGIDGKIKGIKKIIWKTSDAGWGYEPPAVELVNSFYDSLVGADLAKLEELNKIEVGANPDGILVTKATSTSKGLLTALIEGVGYIVELLKTDLPTPEEELLEIAAGMVGEGASFTDVTPTDNIYVKKIYRENSGKGYIAYTVVINERYQRVETETLIYVGMDGKIKDIERLTWKTSDAGWGYEPPTEDLVNSFYDSLIGADLAKLEELNKIEVGANPDGILVTKATSTSKGLLTALIEGLNDIKVLLAAELPTPEEQLLSLAAGMVGGGATFTDVTPDENTFVKKIYRDNGGRGYVVYMVVINERYQRVETETLIYVGMDGKIKDIERLTWKTSDAGWGYEPPAEELVIKFYDSLVGADLAKLEELNKIEVGANPDGILVTKATSTSKGLLTALIEGVKSAKALIAMDMPTAEEKVLELAGDLIGTDTDFENVTPDNLKYVRRIYRDKNGNGYVAYIVVINERYGRVETETLIHVDNNGKIKGINRLTWKTSDAGWGYEPPAEELVIKFYDSLIGADLAKLEELNKIEVGANPDGLLVTKATSTSKGLLTALTEALKSVNELIVKNTKPECIKPDYTARAFGIAIVVAVVAVFTVAIIVNKKRKGGKNG